MANLHVQKLSILSLISSPPIPSSNLTLVFQVLYQYVIAGAGLSSVEVH